MNRCLPECERALILACSLVACLCLVHLAHAQPRVCIDADRQFNYAETCFEQQQYAVAVHEYTRFLHFFPQDDRAKKALYKTGLSYFMDNRHRDAVNVFRNLIDRHPDTEWGNQASFMMSRSYLALGEAGSAINCLQNLVLLTGDDDIKDRGFYEIGWVYLEHPWTVGRTEVESDPGEFPMPAAAESARTCFSKISRRNREKYQIESLSSEINALKTAESRSPALAGSLSVIPGAGQLYCGRYQDSIVAFVLNTAFIFAACEAFTNDAPVLGGLVGLVGTGFYVGNIYGAMSAAHKFNRRVYRNRIDGLRENLKVEFLKKDREPAVQVSVTGTF